MNDKILKILEKLLEYYKSINENKYKISAIQKFIIFIKKLKFEITDSNQLKEYIGNNVGVGKGMIIRVDEILKTGTLKEINQSDETRLINELMKINGIGIKLAKKLVLEHNVKSIDDLMKLIKDNKIELPQIILKSIKFHDKIQYKIPRQEVKEIYLYLKKTIKLLYPDVLIKICGSYRRKLDIINDIDVLISSKKYITKEDVVKSQVLENIISKLSFDKFIVENFTINLDIIQKYIGVCKYKNNPMRRIDIRFIPFESYYTALLYFTGSKQFNVQIRHIAKKKGFKLNEYGLYKGEKCMEIKSEEDIFSILDIPYLEPKERTI